VKEMDKTSSASRVGILAEALSKGLLMGARGNSGVILSQLFRGFAKAVADKEVSDARELAEAFKRGVDTAYKAVIKPVEGTILTVSREAAEKGIVRSRQTDDPAEVMAMVLSGARKSLEQTPRLLPILAETGVVDAGGQGLVYIFEGFLSALRGEEVPEEEGADFPELKEKAHAVFSHRESAQSKVDPATIEHGYCTEFIIKLKGTKPFDEGIFRGEMGAFGDSLLVVADEGLVKVHIHAERPGDALNYAQKFGDLTNIKIENMREQHAHWVGSGAAPESGKEVPEASAGPGGRKPYGIVAVASGDGIVEMFRSLGADAVIEGGQTMNPSTEDIVKAIRELSADHVFVLPNNKNIVMAAEQASGLAEVPVTVLPTKTVLQGLTALLAFDPAVDTEGNREKMTKALAGVRTGEVTYAVRDSQVNGLLIKEGDFIGIFEGQIETVGGSLMATSRDLLQKMLNQGGDLVTILYGKDVTDAQVKELSDFLKRNYPDVESEIQYGGQPLYFFLISIE
jgi:DAK2 domain fusion protein YloV